MNICNVRILWTGAMVASARLLTTVQALGFNQDHLVRLLETKERSRCNLKGSSLSRDPPGPTAADAALKGHLVSASKLSDLSTTKEDEHD